MREVAASYRKRCGKLLHGAWFALEAAASATAIVAAVFWTVTEPADVFGWAFVFWMGVLIGLSAWRVGFRGVYEWTLHDDGRIQTRALFRRRFATRVVNLRRVRSGGDDDWYLLCDGDEESLHLSAKSGCVLADALDDRGESDLIDETGIRPAKRDSLATRETQSGFRNRGEPWRYGVWFAVLGLFGAVWLDSGDAYPGDPFLTYGVPVLGALCVLYAVKLGFLHVYDWQLNEDGTLRTRTLLRRRLVTLTKLKHKHAEDTYNYWVVTRAGARLRLRLSMASGEALADALRERDDAQELIDDGPPRPEPWWSKLAEAIPD